MSSAPSAKEAAKKAQSWSEAEGAEQKRFRIMAGGGVLVVLLLAFFALKPSGDEVVAAAPAAKPAAAAEATPATAEVPAGPSVPGVSGGGGGGFSGGGGRPGGGASSSRTPTRAASAPGFTREHGAALGLSPRAAAALADSAAGRRGARGAAAAPPTSGRAAVSRATTMMSEPGAGTALVTVPSGTPLTLSGCQPAAGATWCRATHASFSGWVRQSDIG